MKKIFLFFCVLSVVISCSKDEDVDPTLGAQGYPHEWVFTAGGETNPPQDPSVATYSYIYTNKNAMFRDDILKSYPLKDLVEEKHCLFYVSEKQTTTGKTGYTIQLNSDKSRFLGVGFSSNKQEVHLQIAKGIEVIVVGNPSYFDSPDGDDGDEYTFYIHTMPDVNGIRTVAIESVGMPGWYISDSPPGFNYAQSVVTLQQSANPASAPKWQCRTAN